MITLPSVMHALHLPPEPPASDLLKWLRNDKRPLSKMLAGGEVFEVPPGQLKILMRSIARDMPPRDAKRLLDALLSYVSQPYWLRLIGDQEYQRFALDLRRRSALYATLLDEAELAARIRASVIRAAPIDSQSAIASVGQMLVSAILNCGAACRDVVVSLCAAAGEPPLHLSAYGYYELNLPHRGVPDQEFRRFFLGPATEILALRLSPVARETARRLAAQRGGPWRAIRAFLSSVGFSSSAVRSLHHLTRVSASSLKITQSQLVVSYLTRAIYSHSPAVSSWLRLNGFRALPNAQDVHVELDDDLEEAGLQRAPGRGTWCHDLLASIRTGNRPAARARLEDLRRIVEAEFGSSCASVVGYAIWLLDSTTPYGKPLRASSVEYYVDQICGSVLGFFPKDLPIHDPDGLGRAYGDALDALPSDGRRRKLAKAIYSYQRYLEVALGASEFDDSEIIHYSHMMAAVDANVITEYEFQSAIGVLQRSELQASHQDIIECCVNILTLLYRCGMRRQEAIGLSLADMHLDAPEIVVVRKNQARTPKTSSSTRNIPVYALLSPEELARLKAWCIHREQIVGLDGFVFGSVETGQSLIPQETIARLIHGALRDATGDPRVHMHVARHSAATRLAWALYQGDGGIAAFDGYRHAEDADKSLRRRLLLSEGNTRRSAYAIASILGHSGPEMTHLHYVHCLDLIAHNALRNAFPVRLADLRGLCGFSRSWAFEVSAQGEAGMLKACRSHYGGRHAANGCPSIKAWRHGAGGVSADAVAIPMSVVEKALHLTCVRDRTVSQVADAVGISPDAACAIKTSAMQLYDSYLETARGYTDPYSHRTKRGGQVVRICCAAPAPLHLIADREASEQVYRHVLEMGGLTDSEKKQAIRIYLDRLWWSKSTVVFDSIDQEPDAALLIRFLETLEPLGFELGLYSYALKRGSEGASAWRAAIGRSRKRSVRRAPAKSVRRATRDNWLGVVVARRGDTVMKGSSAVRYGLQMAYIALGAASL